MKHCIKCYKILPLEDFYRHPGMSDGHLNMCKSCAIIQSRKYRLKNVEAYRKRNRALGRRRSHIDQVVEYQKNNKEKAYQWKKNWAERNRHKKAAIQLANQAVKRGKLSMRNECSMCGSKDNIHKHHPDYTQPLRVINLCSACHRKLHRKYKD